MKPEVTAAVCEWLSGLIIGFTPLLAHAMLHAFADPAHQWDDTWAGDILFVSITNSGLSVVTVFTRLAKGILQLNQLGAHSFIMMALSMVIFLFAGMFYGLVASGHAREMTIFPSVAILVGSTFVSLYFEMILAARMPSGAPLGTIA